MWEVRHGDCLDGMRMLDADSVDAIVCDPPYGLSFMGKDWDHGVPGEPFWAEALRVAKPGAHLLAFGGTRTFHRLACAIEDAGWEIRDCLSWLYGSGFPKSHNGPWGGTALKPAWEPVIMARKPLVGTVAINFATHGTGALNVDGCRIAGAKPATTRGAGGQNGRFGPIGAQGRILDDGAGRWPANVCLDEDAAAMLDAQSGERASTGKPGRPAKPCKVVPKPGMFESFGDKQGPLYSDTGGASRFFYCPKASRSEREAGLDGFEERLSLGARFSSDPRMDRPQERRPFANHHPTVKPVALMRWLVRLVAPTDGVVLDPFMGSGTTGVACVREGRSFVGIEREPEYHAIAEARIAHARGETPADAEQPALPFEARA